MDGGRRVVSRLASAERDHPGVIRPMSHVDYEALFSSHREHLWGLCYRMTGSAAEAEDLVQDTFTRALQTPPADTAAPWRPWLARVATRLAIDALRRRRTRQYVGPWLPTPVELPPSRSGGELASPEPDAEVRYGLRESASLAFLLALEVLTPTQRATLVLRDALGYTGPEVATALGLSADNARTILHRARKALSEYDARRQPPSPQVDTRHEEALQRFMMALQTGDVERIAACLAEDVRSAHDGGGQYRAATKIVQGRDAVARLYEGLLRLGSPPRRIELRWINGRPGIVIDHVPMHPRNAPRSCMTFDVDPQGKVIAIYVILAPGKLEGLAMAGD